MDFVLGIIYYKNNFTSLERLHFYVEGCSTLFGQFYW